MAESWKVTVGQRGSRVTVRERLDRGGALVLGWYEDGKPRSESLGYRLRDDRGKIDKTLAELARAAAEQKALALATRGLRPETRRELTLGETEGKVFHPLTGKYPLAEGQAPTPHQEEARRALRFATAFWGRDRTWASLRKGDIRALWRQRIRALHKEGYQGVRGAEITVTRVLTIARWLQEEELIPTEAAQAGRRWKEELRADWKQLTGAVHDPEPHRPRHSIEELRKLLIAASRVDPRFYTMLMLGAELRLGMVRRLKRSHYDVLANTVTVPSSGKKRGAKVWLTDEQTEAIDHALDHGYLAELEEKRIKGEIEDYHLFPSGKLMGWKAEGGAKVKGHRKGHRLVPGVLVAKPTHAVRGPVSRTAVRDWFREAEQLAGIPHRPGRGTYGLRRAGVDGAKGEGIDRDALKEWGGWSDHQMPDKVYADAEQEKAGKRARDVRAKVRGER